MNFTFSIIICTVHNVKGLEKCINSIIMQTVKPMEIIIVDGGIDNKIGIITENKFRPILDLYSINLIYIKTIKSLVTQRNIGIEHAKGDIIVFFDDDVILEQDYFHYLLEAYQLKWSENLGGIQGTIKESFEKKPFLHVREVIKKIFFLETSLGKGTLLPSARPSFCGNPKEIIGVSIFNGCMMSFKREILLKNKFDLNFANFWAFDDVELSHRISRKYKLYQTPYAKLYHEESSLNYIGHRNKTKMFVFNRFYIFKQYCANRKINWILFYWSNFGELLYNTFVSIKIKKLDPLLGLYDGWKLLYKARYKKL